MTIVQANRLWHYEAV